MGRDRLALVADGMNGDDAPPSHKKPNYPRVEFAYVPQLKQPIAQRFGKRLSVIPPVPQFRQAGQHRRKVTRIAFLELIESLFDRTAPSNCFVEFYAEFRIKRNINIGV